MDGFVSASSWSADLQRTPCFRADGTEWAVPAVSPLSARPRRVAIVVLGVGRSGTSAITRVMNLLGAALPKDVLGAGWGNESGHWEPARLIELHDEILRLHGRNWWSLMPLPAPWFATPEAALFARHAAEIITQEYGSARTIIIKDPRLCLLGPVLFAALDLLGIEARIVLPLRHPCEVTRSICRRDPTGMWRSELQWISHMIEAEALSRRFPRVWVTFDEVLADWRASTNRIAGALRVEWAVAPAEAGDAINAFLAPRLRHFDVRDNISAAAASPLSRRLWAAAMAGRAGDERVLREGFAAARPALHAEIMRYGARAGGADGDSHGAKAEAALPRVVMASLPT